MQSYWFSKQSKINITYNISVITITITMSIILANFGKYAISDCPFICLLLCVCARVLKKIGLSGASEKRSNLGAAARLHECTLASPWIVIPWNYWGCNLPFLWSLIARFMGPTWGPSWADMTQVGPMLAPWTLLSGAIVLCYIFLWLLLHYGTTVNRWG